MNFNLNKLPGLPCMTDSFFVNNKKANINDFGAMIDTKHDDPDRDGYCCKDMRFVPDNENKTRAMEKYDLTEEEFTEMQKVLSDFFRVGECGYCS